MRSASSSPITDHDRSSLTIAIHNETIEELLCIAVMMSMVVIAKYSSIITQQCYTQTEQKNTP